MPVHPPQADSEPAKTRPPWRVIFTAIGIVILLAAIHLLRAVLG